MDLLIGHDETVAQWIGKGLGISIEPPFIAIGVLDNDGVLRGGWIVNGYNGFNGDLTVLSPHFISRRIIRACFAHLFIDLKLTRATAHVRRDNRTQRNLLPRLGFKLECVARRYYGPRKRDDAFVFALFPEKAKKWLNT